MIALTIEMLLLSSWMETNSISFIDRGDTVRVRLEPGLQISVVTNTDFDTNTNTNIIH